MDNCLPLATLHLLRQGLVSGWGRLYSGGPTSPELQTASVDILDNVDCVDKYPDIVTRQAQLICARGQETGGDLVSDSCQGDSGGPLVTEDHVTGHWSLTGVVTGGEGCGYAQYPGLYINISQHIDWILDNTK